MKRLFAAIKVKPDLNLTTVFGEMRKSLRDEKITWVDERNIHITLKFFGETPEDDISRIIDVFEKVTLRHEPFEVGLEQTGIFGSSYNPRVIWFGMSHCEPMLKLADDVLISLEKAGFPRDDQHFRPHLTIGRVRFIQNKKYFQQVIDKYKTTFIQTLPIEKFELIESKLTPRGPVYATLNTFLL